MSWVIGVVSGAGAAGTAGTTGSTPSVRTVLGPGVVDRPAGIALDSAGDLFVADTGHCRVLVLPARTGALDGLRVRSGRATTLAGGSCTGVGAIGHPSDVAVDRRGDVFIAEATAQRVQELRAGSHRVVTVAGTGKGGFSGDGLAGTSSDLDQPTGVAADAAGDLFIADTANCRVRVLPPANVTLFGRTMTAGHLFTVAGTGVCGSAGQGGPMVSAQLWNPVAVTVDAAGDLLVADAGDQSVLLAPPAAGATFFGTEIGTGDIGVVLGGTGSYGPYLADGLPANGTTAELNDPRGLAVSQRGALFVTDGTMHVIRVVPAAPGALLGQTMRADDALHRRWCAAGLDRSRRGQRDPLGGHPNGHASRRGGDSVGRRVLLGRWRRPGPRDRRPREPLRPPYLPGLLRWASPPAPAGAAVVRRSRVQHGWRGGPRREVGRDRRAATRSAPRRWTHRQRPHQSDRDRPGRLQLRVEAPGDRTWGGTDRLPRGGEAHRRRSHRRRLGQRARELGRTGLRPLRRAVAGP